MAIAVAMETPVICGCWLTVGGGGRSCCRKRYSDCKSCVRPTGLIIAEPAEIQLQIEESRDSRFSISPQRPTRMPQLSMRTS